MISENGALQDFLLIFSQKLQIMKHYVPQPELDQLASGTKYHESGIKNFSEFIQKLKKDLITKEGSLREMQLDLAIYKTLINSPETLQDTWFEFKQTDFGENDYILETCDIYKFMDFIKTLERFEIDPATGLLLQV